MTKLRVLSLFAGIGGFDLGLERTGGFETVALCEQDENCQRWLAAHWPGVPIYDDVQTLTAERLRADGVSVDCVVGGFPCQDISLAGKGGGLAGERSGLWAEFARIIGELNPRFVIVENVAALLGRGLDRVLRDLAALRYNAEWHCIPASYVGAHHLRDRLWIVAYPCGAGDWLAEHRGQRSGRSGTAALEPAVVSSGDGSPSSEGAASSYREVSNANVIPLVGAAIARSERAAWDAEPEMDRVVDGVPHRVVEPELRALGNAVVPQIPELIGRAILAIAAAAPSAETNEDLAQSEGRQSGPKGIAQPRAA